jgi:type I restriction enzyme, S subunit
MMTRRLGDMAQLRSGSTPLRGETGFYGGTVPWAKIEDLTRAGMRLTETQELVTDEAIRAARLPVFPVGTVLIAMYGSIGTVSIAGIRTTTNQAILGIECGPELDPEYLWFYLRMQRHELAASGRGGTQANINATMVREMRIPVPPLATQRKIARALMSQLDLAERARSSAGQQLVTRDSLVEACLARRILTRPESGWAEVRLRDVAEIQLGKMLSPASKIGIRPVPYLRIANVQWDRFALADVYEMDFTEAEERKFRLRPGDVLVCEGGQPGRAAIWQGEIERCCYQKALHRIRPLADAIDTRFVLYRLWLGALRGEFTDDQSATTIAHLPAVRLAGLKVRLPNLATQRRIAAELREELCSVDGMGTSLQAQREALEALPTALFRRAFNAAST